MPKEQLFNADHAASLQRTNAHLAAALNSAFDAIWILDHTGVIESVNARSEHLFGYSSEELVGTIPAYLAHDDHFLHDFAQTWMHVLETGMPAQMQGVIYRKDGTPIECNFALAQIESDPGYIVCSIRDMTAIRESQRLKDRFVSMVNHELRQPISVLMLSADKLRVYYDRMTDDQRKANVDQIYQQTRTMLELVESILDLSRLDNPTRVRRNEVVDVAALGSSVIMEFQQNAELKQQRLTVAGFEEGEYPVIGDPVEITRIWRNLISNAVKYTPERGAVSVRLGRVSVGEHIFLHGLPAAVLAVPALSSGDYVVGQVADTGHGIPPDDLPMLFSRFQRGWAAQSNIPGTGLGLALVRELLTQYDGDITVESAKDIGTTFTFYIPSASRSAA